MTTVDWTKPIEAVRKSDGHTVPVTFVQRVTFMRRDRDMVDTNEVPDRRTTNESWHTDGSDMCCLNKWFIRNVAVPVIDWTKPLEFTFDNTPVILNPNSSGPNPDASGDYYLIREDGKQQIQFAQGAEGKDGDVPAIGILVLTRLEQL